MPFPMILIDMVEKKCVRITVKGLVQGIGFRPFIAECAEELNISGIVKNCGGIVIIVASADNDSLDMFTKSIEINAPAGAVISSIVTEDMSAAEFEIECKGYISGDCSFRIADSGSHIDTERLLPPDLAICDTCTKELLDPDNRRYRYPFISCTSCGPRFSIMHTVPYDRDTTTMDIFRMCPDCSYEYTQKGHIRRHAQTISCHRCGPQLKYVEYDLESNIESYDHTIGNDLYSNSMFHDKHKGISERSFNYKETYSDYKEIYSNDKAIYTAIERIKEGKIGAVLDIGGFHFTFSPFLKEPVKKLRIWKNREAKPFAVMFPDIDSIKKYCKVSPKEEELLKSNPRPIVLLNKSNVCDGIPEFADEVLAGSDRVGAMLPCSPLQILLLQETGPLVMTSGNRGGEPIVTDPDIMKSYLGTGGPDFMLTHERKILTPLDDSIYQVNSGVVQIIRRARGLVPWPVDLPFELRQETFAAGGDLKSVFALGKGDKAYLSAHFGDLDDHEAAVSYDHAIGHMEALLDIKPTMYVCDKHPAYISSKKAVKLSGDKDRIRYYQHHLSHVMAVAAEHDMTGRFVGIAFDGTGYGEDNSIWGSEFWWCDITKDSGSDHRRNVKIRHSGSLLPVKMIGGDDGSRDALKSLYCYLHEAKLRGYIDSGIIYDLAKRLESVFKDHRAPDIKLLDAALDHNINTIESTSMGRLFDAVCALLGVCCYNSYEGECASKLEICAAGAKMATPLSIDIIKNGIFYMDGVRLIADICNKLLEGEDIMDLSLGFHKSLSKAAVEVAENIGRFYGYKNKNIAIGGGTFLNRILNKDLQMICNDKEYTLYQNSLVPPGDGGLALGQLYLSGCKLEIKD